MPSKDIVCLAYSTKLGGNCFAGIDLSTGLWIRPISGEINGTLSDNDCCMPSGDGKYLLPNILDVIAIDLLAPEPSRHQPENWRISGAEWQRLRRADLTDMALLKGCLADDPELFLGYERYVSEDDVDSRPPRSSLALVKPESLWWSPKIGKYRRRGIKGTFTFSGATYELPLTDGQYEAKLPMDRTTNGLTNAGIDTWLTISLSDLDRDWGRYYKLIAGVIEIPKTGI